MASAPKKSTPKSKMADKESDKSSMDKLTRMASSVEIGTGVLGSFKFKGPLRTRAFTTSVLETKTDMAEVLASSAPKLSGQPLDYQTAVELKQVLFGSRMFSFDEEWKSSCFQWQSLKGPFPYGLFCPRDKARGVIMAIQVHIVRHLLFEKEEGVHYLHDETDSLDVSSAYRLQPSDEERRQAFLMALVDILWTAGDDKRATVVLQDRKKPGLLHSEEKKLQFFAQSLHVSEFTEKEALRIFLRNHLELLMYHEGGGVLMILFSLILSRTLPKLREDLQGELLFTDRNQCSVALIMMVLTGHATSHLFNGKKVYDKDGEALPKPLIGMLRRAECGFLVVDRSKVKEEEKVEVGSMLKTPRVPVWLTFLNGRYSMLFCTNIRLTSDWRAEHRFLLHYYNGQPDQTEEAVLTIDTKTSAPQQGSENFEERQPPLLEECIHSRWPDAYIDWNRALPFI
ncbi:inactive ubiquitin carboxyl-terminal hydrolase MINDY-4B-like isoform X2 [Acanthaster planci]|uniref:Ubiquitin carboxyl-terminal hydrolase MINDY n=1 Tax=Acanthaster planci TaxID=133434 RepID=A0A8B7Y8D1_ACAPL|nr:inactive ubiquitin carboxyl-terminal hydrolase MINDY-4B-like isoform X2 [Acanthaster planci]XP_022088011.1 inactive ubiquitin carboxyl-terminal hydrolase MINDY-4B-like isoform X2 [Acanthaster planci]